MSTSSSYSPIVVTDPPGRGPGAPGGSLFSAFFRPVDAARGFRINPRKLTLYTACLFFYVVVLIMGPSLHYLMCAAGVSLTLVAWIISRFSLRKVSVERNLPPVACEGEVVELKLQLTHRSRLPRYFVTIRDTLPEEVVPQGGRGPQSLPALWPDRPVSVSQQLLLSKRGCYSLGPVVLTCSDPLGLFSVPTQKRVLRELVVYPQAVRVSHLGFTRESGVSANLLSHTHTKAEGSDFHGVREYLPGDELRRIHWKSTAHRGEFSVIEFEDSLSSDVTVFLDLQKEVQAGQGSMATLEWGIKITASIAQFLVGKGAAVQVIADDDRLLPPSFGWEGNHFHRTMESLARMEAMASMSIESLVDRYSSAAPRGSCAVVITPNATSATEQACLRLRRAGNLTTCFLLEAPAFASHKSAQLSAPRKQPRRAGEKANLAGTEADTTATKTLADRLRQTGVDVRVISPGCDLRASMERG